MKGYILTLDGQPVCLFPFTVATDFESLAHNDLPSHTLVYDDARGQDEPMAVEKSKPGETSCMFGWCFVSAPIRSMEKFDYCIIAKSDRADLARLAIENDEWAEAQMERQSNSCANCACSPCACIPLGDEQD